eukprot:TRINITY_DN1801_c0_g1_i1.p1 TRINITY_DN1801_c0_g1~~TRINITY_DN1801_c0_g1_i1.p1  ORF type:complete len:351 (-),score=100.21 TRINITY_DN1801_c0_g1_i1:103-1155(-)
MASLAGVLPSAIEKKVRSATKDDGWKPSERVLMEIADATHSYKHLPVIMKVIWKRLNDHTRNWKKLYKGLIVLEYILKHGSEQVRVEVQVRRVEVQTLTMFQHGGSFDGKDIGLHVRDKAKEILEWLDANPVGAKKQSAPTKNPSGSSVASHPSNLSSPYAGGPTPVPVHHAQPVPVHYAPQPVSVHQQPQLHPQAYGGGGYPVEAKSLPQPGGYAPQPTYAPPPQQFGQPQPGPYGQPQPQYAPQPVPQPLPQQGQYSPQPQQFPPQQSFGGQPMPALPPKNQPPRPAGPPMGGPGGPGGPAPVDPFGRPSGGFDPFDSSPNDPFARASQQFPPQSPQQHGGHNPFASP